MDNGVQIAFQKFYPAFEKKHLLSKEQMEAAYAIMYCKTGRLGSNAYRCEKCGHVEFHDNSCRNRNCPSCQAVNREVWIDARSSEIIDASYYHVVFTVPHELNGIIYDNQAAMYPLMHRAVSRTLLDLAADKKHLGATPGIIQTLHTWGQSLNYHPHVHCIVTGAGLTPDLRFVKGRDGFFVPVKALSRVFQGKFIQGLQKLRASGELSLPGSLCAPDAWDAFIASLRSKGWVPFIKETFKEFGNAVEYLGRYSHRVAISNNRIVSVTDDSVTFSMKDYRDSSTKEITIPGEAFVMRFLWHVLPKGFQKIRYYGFLNNRFKSRNLAIISRITGKTLSKRRLAGLDVPDIILALWNVDIRACPVCNSKSLKLVINSRARC
jgi:hypothetical protein